VHIVPHAPFEHTCPVPQAWPHTPQLAGSVDSSTQVLPHLVVPPAHASAQAPSEHTWPAAHVLPHVPQLSTSVAVLVQTPWHTDPLAQLTLVSWDASGCGWLEVSPPPSKPNVVGVPPLLQPAMTAPA
jgi:hypothetical protein